MEKRFNMLVGTIPILDGKVLLLQRSFTEKFMPGAWGLPCGKIEHGEDLETAAIRELHEESGLSGTVERLVGYSTFLSQKGDVDLHNVQINFLMSVPSDVEVVLDHSSEAYQWMSLDDVATSDLDEFTRSTIGQAKSSRIS